MNQILAPVIQLLQSEGATEDQIADAITDLITAATAALYKRALEKLTDEDLQKIEDCTDDTEADKLIAALYAQRVGTTPEELTQVFLRTFVQNFLADHAQKSNQ